MSEEMALVRVEELQCKLQDVCAERDALRARVAELESQEVMRLEALRELARLRVEEPALRARLGSGARPAPTARGGRVTRQLRRSPAPHVDDVLCHESAQCSLCAAERQYRRDRSQRRADSESAVQREVRLALSAIGCVVWRNNVGLDAERGVRYGLQVGSGDLIGIAPGGRFLSVECKRRTGGRVSDQQRLWLELVRARGGIAIVARSGDEAVTLVEEALHSLGNGWSHPRCGETG